MTITRTRPLRQNSACPLCESPSTDFLLTGYDRLTAREEEFNYTRCRSCGLVFQDPLPAPEAISGFYDEDYAPHVGVASLKRNKWINRMAIRYYYGTDSFGRSRVLRWVFRHLSNRIMREMHEPMGGNRVLDVGCAAGILLHHYRDLGWQVRGIEISPRACSVARSRGLEVHEGTVYDAPFEPASFDLIMLSHVIEHVLEPERFLAKCAEFLSPGGVILLSTPNAGGLGLKLYGSCWYHLDAPRHLMLFDTQSIKLLAEKSGLRPTRISTLPEARVFCESRHYMHTQGASLPENMPERERIIAASKRDKEAHRVFRKLVGPVTMVSKWLGKGEILEAEFSV